MAPGILLATAGIAWVVGGDAGLDPMGIGVNIAANPVPYVLALLGATAWACYSVLSPVLSGGRDGITVFFTGTAVALWAIYLVTGAPVPHRPSAEAIVALVCAAAVIGAGYAFWNIGILHGNLTALASASYATPVLSSAIGPSCLAPPSRQASGRGCCWSQSAQCSAGGLLDTRTPELPITDQREGVARDFVAGTPARLPLYVRSVLGLLGGHLRPKSEIIAGRQGIGVFGAQHALQYGQEFSQQGGGTGRVTRLALAMGEVVAGGEGGGMFGAQYPFLDGQELSERGGGGGRISQLAARAGEAMVSAERIGVFGALQLFLDGQKFGECFGGAGRISCCSAPVGEVAASSQGVGIFSTQHSFLDCQQLGECFRGADQIARGPERVGEVVAGSEGVGMFGTQYPFLDGQEFGDCSGSTRHIARKPP
ncbi:MAG: hypothetical protein QM619_04555 [Micropruina sp.]